MEVIMLYNRTLYAISLLALLSTTSYLNAINEPDQFAVAPIQQTCMICYDEKDTNQCTTLACSHTFCTQCLEHILDNAIAHHSTETVRCPNPECAKNMELADIAQITNNQEKIVQLLDLKAKEWLTKQENVKQCPTADCSFAFINDASCSSVIECPQCKTEYCSQCLIKHDSEISCEQARAQKLAADDEATQEWKQANTKQCPSCKVHIEKNDGCNHMTCKKCKYEFCWLCLQPRGYGSHICRMYRPEPLPAPIANTVVLPAEYNEHRIFADNPELHRHRVLTESLRIARFAQRFMALNHAQQQAWVHDITIQNLRLDMPVETRAYIWLTQLQRYEYITVRADMPRDFAGFSDMLQAAGINVQYVYGTNTIVISARMGQNTFDRILDQANALYR